MKSTRRIAQSSRTSRNPSTLVPAALRCEYLENPLAIQTIRPRLSWTVTAADPSTRGSRQIAWQVLVASAPALLKSGRADLWDSGRVDTDQTLHVEYAGRRLTSRSRCFWTVRAWDQDGQASAFAAPAEFSVGLLNARDWQGQWIGVGQDIQHPAPMFRREFKLPGSVRRAVLYATALGVYQVHLNGQAVGENVLAPEWTSYYNRVHYQAYDVSRLLRRGANAIGGIVGDGWYAGHLGLAGVSPETGWRGVYGRRTALRAQLHVELTDGRQVVIATDGSWRFTLDGPILSSDLLDGESYDARREMPGWSRGGFDAAAWRKAVVMKPRCGELVAQPNEPLRVQAEITPVAMTSPKKGVFIFNLGQEIAGWCRLKLHGPAGRIVRLRHCERLKTDGHPYTDNLRHAANIDTYVCKGDAEEVFEPRFTYHGFQYVEVTGLDYTPSLKDLTGLAFWSSCPATGEFRCSDDFLNRLSSNILWTQRDNMPGIPTDCPQRDERCGWTGDIQVFAQTGIFNMDMAAFLTKWLRDLADDQAADGRFPDFAPDPYQVEKYFSGVPAWGDAGTIVPWRLYENYADTRVLEEAFEPARRWVDFITRNNPTGLWLKNRGNDYGDWLNADTFKFDLFPRGQAECPKDLFATAFYWQSAHLVARMAEVLGRPKDAQRYANLADRIRRAFHKKYVRPDGRMTGDTQGGYALVLGTGLLEDRLHAKAFAHLMRKFQPFSGHLSTGFIGTVHAMNMLTRFGRSDKAYELLGQRTFPSWGYTIDQGGTTIWERWDGFVEGKGFQDPGMNSFCHYAIGAVGEWMMSTILGISPDETAPGYKHFTIRPIPGGGLTWAQGRFGSIRGPIEVSWRLRGKKLSLSVHVPANTTATIHVPAANAQAVRESGRLVRSTPGLECVGGGQGQAVFLAQSGQYEFTSMLAMGRACDVVR